MQFEQLGVRGISGDVRNSSARTEVTLLVQHLTEGFRCSRATLYVGSRQSPSNVPHRVTASNTLRTGAIVVGRYRGVQCLANTIGLGRWSTTGNTPEVTGGAIYLDQNYDRSNEARRLLRIHELGHALGYLHVTKHNSIMNPAIGSAPTEFDRNAAIIAFERMPGNQSPDNDVAGRATRTRRNFRLARHRKTRLVAARPLRL